MNNFFEIEGIEISLEKPDTSYLEEREGNLKTLIEATGKLKATSEWSTLKSIFEDEIERLERLQRQEASKSEINAPELYRLQGRLVQAKRHSLDALEAQWREELLSVRKLTPATSRGKLREE